MKNQFITTEDKKGKIYIINTLNIVLIEETEHKYSRMITINEVDEHGAFRKIESVHSVKELENMINEIEN